MIPALEVQDVGAAAGWAMVVWAAELHGRHTFGGVGDFFIGVIDDHKGELFYPLVALVWALIRALGVTIKTGQTGLQYSFGRAHKVLQPGFHLLVPFLQVARRLPTRSRTLDLPGQRVTTNDGLVLDVEANLVYRVVDIKRALIQIDELERGMLQMLGLGVQEVLRGAAREELRDPESLNMRLAECLERQLGIWGVQVEKAGFTTITPSQRTLRITQLAELVGERERMLDRFERGGVRGVRALALMGTRARALPRSRFVRERELVGQHRRRVKRALLKRGYERARIKAAERRLPNRVAEYVEMRKAAKAAKKKAEE